MRDRWYRIEDTMNRMDERIRAVRDKEDVYPVFWAMIHATLDGAATRGIITEGQLDAILATMNTAVVQPGLTVETGGTK